MSNTVSPNGYKILGESAALFASTFAISKTSLVTWLNAPSTIEGLALCTGVNACTTAIMDVADQAYNKEGKTAYHIALQVVGLVSSLALLTTLAKSTASWCAGMLLHPCALAKLTAVHGAVKATIYFGYALAQSAAVLKTIANIDDMKGIPDTELGLRKKQFEDLQTKTWDSYSLNMQAVFNSKLKENEQDLLPFTSLTTDESLSKEELEIYCESVGDKPTVEQAKVLIAHDVLPPKGCDILPNPSLENVAVEKLSETELRWYHHAFSQKTTELSSTQQKAFAEAFYKLDLAPPTYRLALSQNFGMGTIPESATNVSTVRAQYFVNHYSTSSGEYQYLTPEQQLVLRNIFKIARTQPLPVTAPKKEDLKNQPKEVLEQLSLQYDADANSWNTLTPDYQIAFNEALKNHELPARKLTPQPWSKKKKFCIYVVPPMLITCIALKWLWDCRNEPGCYFYQPPRRPVF